MHLVDYPGIVNRLFNKNMRLCWVLVGVLLIAALGDAAVVQRRYRNTEEVLVPVTVIQDGEEIKEIKIEDTVQPQLKNVATEVIAEEIAKAVDVEQKLEAVEAVVEAQRQLDEGVLEDEIKDVIIEENKELLKNLQEKEEQLEEIKEEQKQEEEKLQDLKNLPTEEVVIQPETVPESPDNAKDLKKLPVDVIVKQPESVVDSDEKPVPQQLKSVVDKENSEEVVESVDTNDKESEPEGTLRQATQATPAQTTQQNFVQQLIQSSPLGQFFNQITGQNNQGQVANDETGSAPANPNPTIPGFLAPAITAAQSVVNTTTNAFQGLTNLASNIGTTFQNTLSSFTGQQPAQQASSNDATTARPQGPFQQLVSTIMGNNNNQQATPAGSQPAPQQQGPLQGLLNIFQGNNANNNRPQANAPSVATSAPQPGKEPETVEQTQAVVEDVAINSPDNLSNEIRTSAEVDDSFEDSAQPDELIVVQDDASQPQEQEQ